MLARREVQTPADAGGERAVVLPRQGVRVLLPDGPAVSPRPAFAGGAREHDFPARPRCEQLRGP